MRLAVAACAHRGLRERLQGGGERWSLPCTAAYERGDVSARRDRNGVDEAHPRRGAATGEGYFFQPTALADVPLDADAMNNEPFGPMALIRPFATEEDALDQANRLPYGLAAFAFTENGRRINRVADGIESGMVGINSFVISANDMPFGGIKESGFGSESGPEGLDGYLVTKAVHIY